MSAVERTNFHLSFTDQWQVAANSSIQGESAFEHFEKYFFWGENAIHRNTQIESRGRTARERNFQGLWNFVKSLFSPFAYCRFFAVAHLHQEMFIVCARLLREAEAPLSYSTHHFLYIFSLAYSFPRLHSDPGRWWREHECLPAISKWHQNIPCLPTEQLLEGRMSLLYFSKPELIPCLTAVSFPHSFMYCLLGTNEGYAGRVDTSECIEKKWSCHCWSSCRRQRDTECHICVPSCLHQEGIWHTSISVTESVRNASCPSI